MTTNDPKCEHVSLLHSNSAEVMYKTECSILEATLMNMRENTGLLVCILAMFT